MHRQRAVSVTVHSFLLLSTFHSMDVPNLEHTETKPGGTHRFTVSVKKVSPWYWKKAIPHLPRALAVSTTLRNNLNKKCSGPCAFFGWSAGTCLRAYGMWLRPIGIHTVSRIQSNKCR